MTDIAERLSHQVLHEDNPAIWLQLMRMAVDEIKQQAAEIAQLTADRDKWKNLAHLATDAMGLVTDKLLEQTNEHERCAKVCDRLAKEYEDNSCIEQASAAEACAAAIRKAE